MKREISLQDNKIAALIFDMDGLIFDSERIVQKSWTITSKELGLPDVGAHIYYTIGFNAVRREEYFFKTFGQTFPSEEFAVLARKNFQAVAEAEGMELKPGAKELMILAKELDLKVAVATSSREAHALEMLKEANLYQYIDGAVYGDRVKNAKPDPEIYITACGVLAVNPAESIALEDSPAGIQSAHAAGMLPIMIPDLVQPDESTSKMCFGCFETLNSVIDLLK